MTDRVNYFSVACSIKFSITRYIYLFFFGLGAGFYVPWAGLKVFVAKEDRSFLVLLPPLFWTAGVE